jgi:hypothetical protein
VLWIAWVAVGFNSNWASFPLGQPGADAVWSWVDEALNVATKTMFALALMLGRLGPKLDHDEVERLSNVRSARRRDSNLQLHGVGGRGNAG